MKIKLSFFAKCAVSDTVAPGTYKLRVVAHPAYGEWKIVTMALDGVPNSIDFKVQ